MKALMLFCFCVLLQFKSAAHWPVGTTWVYWQTVFNPFETYGDPVLQITADTIIQNENAKIISAWSTKNPGNKFNRIIKTINKKVYLLDEGTNSFVLIYNFNLNSGDTISYYLTSQEVSTREKNYVTYQIDSIKTLKTSGADKKIFYQHKIDGHNCYDYPGVIYEDIGNDFYFFLTFCAVDPPLGGGLICFTTDSFHYPGNKECVIPTANIDFFKESINVFPNPTNGIINIQTTNEKHTRILLYNALGESVEFKYFNGGIDIQNLQNGLYYLVIIGKREIIHQQIMKF